MNDRIGKGWKNPVESTFTSLSFAQTFLFPDSLVHAIFDQTNNFADHLTQTNFSPKSRIKKRKQLPFEEFLIFIGLLFHNGTIPPSRISDYWSIDTLFDPCFRKCMSRDRFLSILQALHFSPIQILLNLHLMIPFTKSDLL